MAGCTIIHLPDICTFPEIILGINPSKTNPLYLTVTATTHCCHAPLGSRSQCSQLNECPGGFHLSLTIAQEQRYLLVQFVLIDDLTDCSLVAVQLPDNCSVLLLLLRVAGLLSVGLDGLSSMSATES